MITNTDHIRHSSGHRLYLVKEFVPLHTHTHTHTEWSAYSHEILIVYYSSIVYIALFTSLEIKFKSKKAEMLHKLTLSV